MKKYLDRGGYFLLALIAWLALQEVLKMQIDKNSASRDPTTISSAAAGVRALYLLSQKLGSEHAVRRREPIWSADDLGRNDVLLLLSPKRPPTAREIAQIVIWVKDGGRLIVSYESESELRRLYELLSAFISTMPSHHSSGLLPGLLSGSTGPSPDPSSGPLPGPSAGSPPGLSQGSGPGSVFGGSPDDSIILHPKIDHQFENRVSRAVNAYEGESVTDYTRSEEIYEIYSPLRFDDDICMASEIACYMRKVTSEKGSVTVFLGIPPFASGLIDKADNAKLAARLVTSGDRIVFDEYHLFIDDKTLRDLLLNWQFLVPMLGIILGIFLFLYSSDSLPDPGEEDKTKPTGPRSFHAFNRDLLRRVASQSSPLSASIPVHAKLASQVLPLAKEHFAGYLQKLKPETETGTKTEIETTPESEKDPKPGTPEQTMSEETSRRLATDLALIHQEWLKSRRIVARSPSVDENTKDKLN